MPTKVGGANDIQELNSDVGKGALGDALGKALAVPQDKVEVEEVAGWAEAEESSVGRLRRRLEEGEAAKVDFLVKADPQTVGDLSGRVEMLEEGGTGVGGVDLKELLD